MQCFDAPGECHTTVLCVAEEGGCVCVSEYYYDTAAHQRTHTHRRRERQTVLQRVIGL